MAYWDFTTSGKPECEQKYVALQVAVRRICADPGALEQLTRLSERHAISDDTLARQATLLRNQFLGNQMDAPRAAQRDH